MGIPINSLCVECLAKKYLPNARAMGSSEKAFAFSKEMLQILLDTTPGENSTVVGPRIDRVFRQYYDLPDDRYAQEKALSNQFVKERLDLIRSQAAETDDSVFTALCYAIMGNYLDFSALGKSVSFETLEQMLLDPLRFAPSKDAYQQFCEELAQAKTLLYVTDNAGEIGFDWVLAEQLQKRFPQLTITFCVRGKPVHNDATLEDYHSLGIPFPVIQNGTAIGGTDLNTVNQETLTALAQSDVVLAKGMGNTETLWGSDYNIYFAFLIKCTRFQEVFQLPMLSPAFMKCKKDER